MRTIARFALVFALAAVVMGRAPGAWACSCAFGDEADHLKWADVAFVGVVFDSDAGGATQPGYSSHSVSWRFDVEEELKGDLARRVVVRAESDSAACGTAFVLGHRYRIYANEEAGKYGTGLCSGNEDLGPAGRAVTPDPTPSPTRTASANPTPDDTPTPVASPRRSIDAVAAGAPVDGGGGSGGLVAAFGLLTAATTVGALVFTRRRRT